MEFEKEMADAGGKPQEPDHELLQLQRRKSMPKVVIEEFVPDETQEEDKNQAGTPAKVMTHHEIDDVSIFRSRLTPFAIVRQA